jgi:hypothetical protein
MLIKCNKIIIIIINMKNFTTLYGDVLNISFIKGQAKFHPSSNIDLPGCPYSLHGYPGQLEARSTSVEKAIRTCSCHSMHFLIAARIRVNIKINFFLQLHFKVSAV